MDYRYQLRVNGRTRLRVVVPGVRWLAVRPTIPATWLRYWLTTIW